MPSIETNTLKTVREDRGLTQAQLAENSKVNVNTISRLERGASRVPRGNTLTRLAKALRVTEDVLRGQSPFTPKQKESSPFLLHSNMTIEISDSARNAMRLVTLQYGLTRSQIVELAPFLAAWAAERSLQLRLERLEALQLRTNEVEALADDSPHLSPLLFFNTRQFDVEHAERESIGARDIFGYQLDPSIAEEGNPDAEDDVDNPFARFLQRLAKEMGEGAEFHRMSELGSPHYEVCRSAAERYLGGDVEAADRLLRGLAVLDRMPAEIAKVGQSRERAKWVRAEATEAIARIDAEFPELGELAEKLALSSEEGDQ